MMEYYYSGTESLWCGNWNHLACRRWKCEVDHPSQSTEVNLGKKQKWCSLKIIYFTLRVNKGHISLYCKNIIELCIRIHGADMRGYICCSSQRSTVSSTVHVHILGVEKGFERGVGWGKVRKKEVFAFISDLCRTKAEHTYIRCVKILCKVREQYMYHKW